MAMLLVGGITLAGAALCLRASFISGRDYFGTRIAPDANRQLTHLHGLVERSREKGRVDIMDGYSPYCGFSSEWAAAYYTFYSMCLYEIAQREPERAAGFITDLTFCARSVLRVPTVVSEVQLDGYFADRSYVRGSAIQAGYAGIVLSVRKLIAKDSLFDVPMKQNNECMVNHIGQCLDCMPQFWSSDQATQLYAIWLYDQATGESHQDLFRRWERVMRERFMDRGTGLLYSNIATKPDRHLDEPLGSSIGWTALFLADVLPEFARDQYQRLCQYREKRYFNMAGVTEFPKVNPFYAGDTDSGPLLLGMSPSATGEAFCCHKLFGDQDRFTRILRVFEIFGGPRRDGTSTTYYRANALGDAILLYAKVARCRYPNGVPVEAHDRHQQK